MDCREILLKNIMTNQYGTPLFFHPAGTRSKSNFVCYISVCTVEPQVPSSQSLWIYLMGFPFIAWNNVCSHHKRQIFTFCFDKVKYISLYPTSGMINPLWVLKKLLKETLIQTQTCQPSWEAQWWWHWSQTTVMQWNYSLALAHYFWHLHLFFKNHSGRVRLWR